MSSVAYSPGTGKTHLSIALGIRACLAGQRVAFRTATEWVAMLADAQRQGRLDSELDRLQRIPLLIVDEVGYIPFDPHAANLMFMLVSRRYERASLIVTSNKPFSAWGEIFGDEVTAAAARRSTSTRRFGRPRKIDVVGVTRIVVALLHHADALALMQLRALESNRRLDFAHERAHEFGAGRLVPRDLARLIVPAQIGDVAILERARAADPRPRLTPGAAQAAQARSMVAIRAG